MIRVGAVVAVRGCFGEDACMDDDEEDMFVLREQSVCVRNQPKKKTRKMINENIKMKNKILTLTKC